MALRRGPLARQIRTYSRICSRLTASSTLLFYAVKEPKTSRTTATVEAMVLFRARRRYKSLPAASGTAAATCANLLRVTGAVRFVRSDLAAWDRRRALALKFFDYFCGNLMISYFGLTSFLPQTCELPGVASRCSMMIAFDTQKMGKVLEGRRHSILRAWLPGLNSRRAPAEVLLLPCQPNHRSSFGNLIRRFSATKPISRLDVGA
jgi:hypothetical protein